MNSTGDIRIDNIMPRLNETWIVIPFEECLVQQDAQYIHQLKRDDIKSSGSIPVIDQGEAFIAGYTDDSINRYPGALPVVVFGDHTRRFKFIDFVFAIGAQGTRILHPFSALVPKFFYYYLCALNLKSEGYSRHYKFLKQASVPIPPYSEQKRIVAKLEVILGKVDACQKRMERIPLILKRFRQAVLVAACSGRLTKDWRKSNPIQKDSETIVNNIRAKREKEAKTHRQLQNINDIYTRPEENDSDTLPHGWKYVALAKLCKSFDYGTSTKSKASGKIPVLRMGNLQNGMIVWGNLVYTSDEKEIKNYLLKPQTVLFNRTNSPELVGKTAIYRGEQPAIFAGYLIRINQYRELAAEYLNLCLNTNYAREFCQRAKTDGVSQSNINAQKLSLFEIPFCPYQEQQEIVRRVDALFAFADRIEERYNKAKAQTDKLTQAILAKAFRGELVPQDPNDEPASMLLERIRQERLQKGEGGNPNGKRRGRRAKGQERHE